MPRPNTGPKLFVNKKRGGFFYIKWTEAGRSRICSTGTKDCREAEEVLADFIHTRDKKTGPRDPAETLVTAVLADYAEAKEDSSAAKRIGYAIVALSPFWRDKTVAVVNEATCQQYAKRRSVSASTIRRELKVLRASINFAVKTNQLTRGADVWLTDE